MIIQAKKYLSEIFSGDYTLDINPVLLEDDADFQCQVGAIPGVGAIRSVDAHLTVTVPPEPPKIYNGKEINTVETRTVEIRCESRGGKPVAEVRKINTLIYKKMFQDVYNFS